MKASVTYSKLEFIKSNRERKVLNLTAETPEDRQALHKIRQALARANTRENRMDDLPTLWESIKPEQENVMGPAGLRILLDDTEMG